MAALWCVIPLISQPKLEPRAAELLQYTVIGYTLIYEPTREGYE
jgi:hypothetical protein